MQDEKMMQMYI